MIGFNYIGRLGQLGNQMFQYASIRGIARKNNLKFTIPKHNQAIKDSLGNTLRIELFDVFDLNPDEIAFLQTNKNYQESKFNFDEDLYNKCEDGVNLIGFFQSYKYFEEIEDEIRKEFSFKKQYLDAYEEVKSILDNPIALHIRRGDFLINSGNHYNLSLNYYQKALEEFDSNRQVIIFSDDTDWCKQQKLFSDDRFLICETKNSYVDLCIMSKCSDFIIANSTFSWWGAWLSSNSNKKVIYPDKWFGPNNQDKSIEDLFPNNWIMIAD